MTEITTKTSVERRKDGSPTSAEWRFENLGRIVTLENGRAFKPKEWTDLGMPIIRIQNLNDAGKPFNHCDFPIENKYIVRRGDLLLAWSGTPGTSFGVHIWRGATAALNQHIFKVKIVDRRVEKEFLAYVVNQGLSYLVNRAHGGAGLKHVTKSVVEGMKVPIPFPEEQRRIVRILAAADTAVRKSDEAIAGTERLKRVLMQELMTKGIGHEEFKNTAIGRIPKDWEMLKLKKIMAGPPQNGIYKSGELFGTGTKIVRMTELFRSERLKTSDLARVTLADREADRYSLAPGDLLFARRSLKVEGAGKCSVVSVTDERVVFESSIIRVGLNRNVASPQFYLSYLNHVGRRQIRKMVRSVAVSGITGTDLKEVSVPRPPLPEQERIVEILSTVERKLELQKEKRRKLERVKKGLMNELLTGRIRVKV